MPLFMERIIEPIKVLYRRNASDSRAEAKARTTPGWSTLDDATKQKIIDNLSTQRNKVEVTEELIGDLTEKISVSTEMTRTFFDARKFAVQEYLARPDTTTETVERVKKLLGPVSFRTLGQWLEEVVVLPAITKHIATRAAEASARNEAAKAAQKSDD